MPETTVDRLAQWAVGLPLIGQYVVKPYVIWKLRGIPLARQKAVMERVTRDALANIERLRK